MEAKRKRDFEWEPLRVALLKVFTAMNKPKLPLICTLSSVSRGTAAILQNVCARLGILKQPQPVGQIFPSGNGLAQSLPGSVPLQARTSQPRLLENSRPPRSWLQGMLLLRQLKS